MTHLVYLGPRDAVTVAIIDYGSGNLHSAAKAFERAARQLDVRYTSVAA